MFLLSFCDAEVSLKIYDQQPHWWKKEGNLVHNSKSRLERARHLVEDILKLCDQYNKEYGVLKGETKNKCQIVFQYVILYVYPCYNKLGSDGIVD